MRARARNAVRRPCHFLSRGALGQSDTVYFLLNAEGALESVSKGSRITRLFRHVSSPPYSMQLQASSFFPAAVFHRTKDDFFESSYSHSVMFSVSLPHANFICISPADLNASKILFVRSTVLNLYQYITAGVALPSAVIKRQH